MHYAKIMKNDVVNGAGVCVSFWTQGCHFHCQGCHNPQTWDFNGGLVKDESLLTEEILSAINANGIHRNFSILGGEPLCAENLYYVDYIVNTIKNTYPNIKIFLWTGYEIEQLDHSNAMISRILNNLDMLVCGPFILKQRDITLPYRGSANQRVLYKGKDF